MLRPGLLLSVTGPCLELCGGLGSEDYREGLCEPCHVSGREFSVGKGDRLRGGAFLCGMLVAGTLGAPHCLMPAHFLCRRAFFVASPRPRIPNSNQAPPFMNCPFFETQSPSLGPTRVCPSPCWRITGLCSSSCGKKVCPLQHNLKHGHSASPAVCVHVFLTQ